LVLTPLTQSTGVSKKIEDVDERARLKNVLEEFSAIEGYGIIARTASSKLSKKVLKKDYDYLSKLWSDIKKREKKLSKKGLVHTEMGVGQRVIREILSEEVEKITNQDIARELGGLPEEKMHCSVMGMEALEKAISTFRGEEIRDDADTEGEIICHCFGVTEPLIRKVVEENHLATVEEVTNYTKAGGACGSCIPRIEDIIADVLKEKKEKAADVTVEKKPLTNITRMRLVEETIANVIRPELQKDGGNIELVDIDGKNVFVALRGACANCVVSDVTLKNLVESKLREFVEEDIVVIESK